MRDIKLYRGIGDAVAIYKLIYADHYITIHVVHSAFGPLGHLGRCGNNTECQAGFTSRLPSFRRCSLI